MIALLKKHPFFADKHITSCVLLVNQGYCNENYLLLTTQTKYIVRKLLRDDIDREFEWEVQSKAFTKSITAEPLIFDKEHEIMIFEFLEGSHKNVLDTNDVLNLAYVLHKLHTISVEAKPIELYIENKTIEIKNAFETIERYPKDHVLCHNDLNPKNIFITDEVKLIDWEYAGVNDRYFDLACVCVEFSLDDVMQRIFLDAYFSDKYALEKLEAFKVIYVALCKEWFSPLK